MSTPLTAVLQAVQSGARTLAEIGVQTGLSLSMVEASVDHLIRTKRINVRYLQSACPAGVCSSCPVASLGGEGGCFLGQSEATSRSALRVLLPIASAS